MRTILAVLVTALGAAPAQEAASDVAGVVRFAGDSKPKRLNDLIDKDRHGGPHRDGRDILDEAEAVGKKGELAHVLVRVKGAVKGDFPAPADPVVLDAADYQFRPRVVVVQPGQVLRLRNSGFDRFNFNGKAARNRGFNVNLARGGTHDVRFTETESSINVAHDCCPWQVAWVHVIEHPFHAVTGGDGAFRIKGLPAGEYELESWHEKFGVRSAKVTVDGKGAVTRDFTFERAAK